MILKYLGHFLAILILTIVDITIMPRLSWGLEFLHLFPLALIFVFLLSNIRLTAVWALVGGFIYELFEFGPYGFHLLGLVLVVAVIAVLFERVMTNRSLYAISVVAMAITLVYDLSLITGEYMGGRQIASGRLFFQYEGLAILYSVLISLLAFYIINAITRRLRSVFLAKKDYRL